MPKEDFVCFNSPFKINILPSFILEMYRKNCEQGFKTGPSYCNSSGLLSTIVEHWEKLLLFFLALELPSTMYFSQSKW